MPRVRLSIRGLMVVVAIAVVITRFVAVPLRNAADQSNCQANLRAISLALLSYHSSHGSFPPAYTTDALGKPLHSWRVLILPYAGEDALYRAVRLDEPWNGPNNAKLMKRMPSFVACPAYAEHSRSSYAVVVGKDMIFPEAGCTSISQVVDGTSNTISVVEIKGNGIPWMEPRDLRLIAPAQHLYGQEWTDFTLKAIADLHRQGLANADQHPKGPNYLFVDGRVISARCADQILHARLTINGSEVWCIEEY
jgi:prepilin-type processing-associated H-X9-DG protein